MVRLVGLEGQVAVGMCWLPVHCSIQAAILLPLEWSVQEWEGSISFDLHCELDDWPKAVQMVQELLDGALLQDAESVIDSSTYLFHMRGGGGGVQSVGAWPTSSKNSM